MVFSTLFVGAASLVSRSAVRRGGPAIRACATAPNPSVLGPATLSSYLAGPTAERPAALVCVGNDAGDIDSLVSAIGLAALLRRREPTVLHTPCAPFPRADFRLRQDACLLFAHCEVQFDDAGAPAELVHLDDLEVASASWTDDGTAATRTGLALALTDHNVCLPGVASAVSDAPVVAIVDHHNDEQKHLETAATRSIDPAAGSTCSMIVEMIGAEAADGDGGDDDGASAADELLGGPLGVLLLGAMAVDTRGFDPALLGTKFSTRDVAAGQALLSALGAAPLAASLPDAPPADVAAALRTAQLPPSARVAGATTPQELSAALLKARYSVDGLGPAELLRLDYKEAVAASATVGVAAICVTRAELLERSVVEDDVGSGGGGAGLERAMAVAAARRGVDILFALTAEDDAADGGLKSLVVYTPNEDMGTNAEFGRRRTRTPFGNAVLASMAQMPLELPARLAEQPLFAAQAIPEEGFGLRWAAVPGGASSQLRMSTLRAAATRKTLMPAIVHFCELHLEALARGFD